MGFSIINQARNRTFNNGSSVLCWLYFLKEIAPTSKSRLTHSTYFGEEPILSSPASELDLSSRDFLLEKSLENSMGDILRAE